MVSVMLHFIQAHLLGDSLSIWLSLIEGSLVGSAGDIVLKHGAFVPGYWNMLGVLDAFPDFRVPSPEGELPPVNVDEVIAQNAGTPVGSVAAQFAVATRELLGR